MLLNNQWINEEINNMEENENNCPKSLGHSENSSKENL